MVGYNFGPPAIDFSPLGRLGDTYDRSVKRTREADIAARREAALAGFGQNGDLAALGKTLLQAGDLEGGMSALRLQASNEGTPFQRARAAQEDARAAEADAYRRRQEEENNRRYEETQRRANQGERVTKPGFNEFGDPTLTEGWKFGDGHIEWKDGTVSAPPGGKPPGPQSGGPGDPNLPAPLSVPAGGPPLTESGQPEYGYAIPGTGQRFPHGTILPPKGDTATAVQAPPTAVGPGPAPIVTPGPTDVPAQGAQAQQGTAIAPPAGQVAVAAPAVAEAAPTPPLTATQINKGTEHIAPMTNAEMIAEARRLGIRPGEYRAGREAAIKKEMAAKAEGLSPGQTTDMKNKLAKARQVAPLVERELNSLNALVQKHGTEYFPGAVKAEMQSTYTNLLMQLKEMYGLGALQAKDIEMVENLLTDPTSSGWNPFEAAYKGVSQEGVTAAQVAKVKQIVRDGLIEAEKNLGGDPTRVPEVSRTAGGGSSYTSKSGVKVEW